MDGSIAIRRSPIYDYMLVMTAYKK